MKYNTIREGKYTFIILIIVGVIGYIINPFNLFRSEGAREMYPASQTPSPTPCHQSYTSGYLLEGGKLIVPTTEIRLDDPCNTQYSLTQFISGIEQTTLNAEQSDELLTTIFQQIGETAIMTRIQIHESFGAGLVKSLEPTGYAIQAGPYLWQDFLIIKDNDEAIPSTILFQQTSVTWEIIELFSDTTQDPPTTSP